MRISSSKETGFIYTFEMPSHQQSILKVKCNKKGYQLNVEYINKIIESYLIAGYLIPFHIFLSH